MLQDTGANGLPMMKSAPVRMLTSGGDDALKAADGNGEDGIVEEEEEDALQDHDGVTSNDFSRGKRLKRLIKMLTSTNARKALAALKTNMWITVCVLMVIHLGIFVAIIVSINRLG